MSYLEMALRVGRSLDAPNAGCSAEARPAPAPVPVSAPIASPVPKPANAIEARESKREELSACGSPNCAGCYDVGDGRKIHPPKCSEEYLAWHEKWEAKGKIQ